VKVASAVSQLQRLGDARQEERRGQEGLAPLDAAAEEAQFAEGYYDERGAWHYFDDFADGGGDSEGGDYESYDEVAVQRKRGGLGARGGGRRPQRHAPGWKGEGRGYAAAPRGRSAAAVAPSEDKDYAAKASQFELSQRARVRCVPSLSLSLSLLFCC
jgi:hypothetical protein